MLITDILFMGKINLKSFTICRSIFNKKSSKRQATSPVINTATKHLRLPT